MAIVGTVGSGKSSLLSAILGELHQMEGNLRLNGSVAYTAQQVSLKNRVKHFEQSFFLNFNLFWK